MKNHRRKKLHSPIFLLLALLLSGCGSGAGKDGKPDKAAEADPSIPVEVATATRQSVTASFTGTAGLEPENQAQVVAKASGVLLQLLVEEGDRVRAGQLLARLDDERQRLELARAEADLKRLENERRRSDDLFARKLVSGEAHDRARFDLETQKAVADLARLDLEYTRVVAPIDGVISERMVKVGNLIQLQQVLFRIDDFDPLLAVLNVPERELATIHPGQPVRMQVDALPGQAFSGTVARVSPVVEAGTGTFRATAEFRDPAGRLKSGMFGRVSVIYDQRKDALVVPREALLEADGTAAVYVLDRNPPAPESKTADDKDKRADGWFARWFGKSPSDQPKKVEKPAPAWYARRVEVKLGYLSGGDAEILEGLKDGDRVVTVGKNALRDGVRLQVVGEDRP